uniref:1-aminocyclopropane-1-carboxylate synthase n=1 Tax=Ananas comosus var. bracteatus TaxID=296719 RepID=A0A6V7NUV6_ANACO|nr:unnamed protein product [Ananas comosus var. bracteatus]
MTREELLSRKASRNCHGQDSSYFLGWQEYEKNPYHPTTNPAGIIQMGLAENQLSFDLVESWLEGHPDAGELKRDGVSVFRELALFQDYHGLPAFKNALAQLMEEIRGNEVRFDPAKLVLTAALLPPTRSLCFASLNRAKHSSCQPILSRVRTYPLSLAIILLWRTGVEIVPIRAASSNGFKITKMALTPLIDGPKSMIFG